MITESQLVSQIVARDFLDESACAEVAQRVNGLRNRWTRRSENVEFFTLGTASYLDGPIFTLRRNKSHDEYLSASAATNSILSSQFGDLYRDLLTFLEEQLQEPAGYDEHLSLPGFHIFEFDGSEAEVGDPSERAHFDMQFMRAVPGVTPDATISFTLPLQQPSGGAGLAIWQLRREDMLQQRRSGVRQSVRTFARQNPCERMKYTTGQMIMFDGYLLHAIDSPHVPTPDGQRITLQGHGIRTNGRWTIYW